jgi:F-type H+-transporting ATPase subunit a
MNVENVVNGMGPFHFSHSGIFPTFITFQFPIFAPNFAASMNFNSVKFFVVAVFSVFLMAMPVAVSAQHDEHANHEAGGHKEEKKGGFDANKVIFSHILDAHEFHLFEYHGSDGQEHHVTIPLPVILYSPQKGFSVFMSSKFDHGHAEYNGYKMEGETIVSTEPGVTVYDFSLTRNVVQMLLALAVLIWIMTSVAAKYKGAVKAPTGMQNAIEPVVTFIRDEVARPNLGKKADRYLPYLLTVFFFILVNNIFGLIPAAANVTGNIAFTLVLAVISFIVILASTNKHYWGHIFNPPVPGGVKAILVPVEILGVFTKPFALMIRLFANMMAGHIIIICLISLIFIFSGISTGVGVGFSPVSIAFAVFIYLIEVMVAFIQAFIFTNLTAVFISQAFEGEHEHEAHH